MYKGKVAKEVQLEVGAEALHLQRGVERQKALSPIICSCTETKIKMMMMMMLVHQIG